MSKITDTALIYVTTSNIHGKGLFARKRIRAGTLIGQIDGRPTSIDGPYVLWLTQSEGVEVRCQLKYINHCDEPNAIYYDTLEVIALRDIQRDEEITHNYDSE
ncbi:MAG TPA: SET domain-containing protein [Acidiferrobacterales bacterium]|nr:SET domain-containing protein [Acidiferrobacterales bacterium]